MEPIRALRRWRILRHNKSHAIDTVRTMIHRAAGKPWIEVNGRVSFRSSLAAVSVPLRPLLHETLERTRLNARLVL